MKIVDFQQSEARKICVYGPPKTGGKTDLVGQMSEKKKLWWFDLEDGGKTLTASPRIKKEWLDNIEYFHIPDTQPFPIAIQTLLNVIKGKEQHICHLHGVCNCAVCRTKNLQSSRICLSEFTPNDVLVVDSVTQLSQSAMNYIQKEIIAKDQFDKKPDWDDYFNQGRILDRIFSVIQQAPFNFVCISHENLVEMEDKNKKLVPVAGTSEFSKKFAKYFDDVVYCNVVNKKHKAISSTTYSGNILAGSRAGKALEDMDNASLLKLFE